MEQKKNYDSDFCGSLPLHLINLVQPYGLLLVLQLKDYTIIQVSENIESITGLSAKEIINKNIVDFLVETDGQRLVERLSKGIKGKIPLRLNFSIKGTEYSFLALIQTTHNYILLELEETKKDGEAVSFTEVYQEVKYAMAEINQAESIEEISNRAIAELKRLSGFDKIMIYKFDEEWNGKVIAETMEDGFDSYLGLHFPASDIPKQARDLYLKNPYRLIPVRDYTPVKIYPVINPVTNSFIDLTNCNIRSVPSVHLEYLKNMGVMASMSTAIIKDDQLWGLISCHHKTEKYLNYEMCCVFELMAGTISGRITSLANKERLQFSSSLQQIQSKLMEQVYLDDNPATGIMNYENNILQLLGCEGAVIFYHGKMQTIGNVPERYELQDLVLWLQGHDVDQLFSVNNFSEQYENAISYAGIGSGIIALPIHVEKGDYIIGFRPEVTETVNWGGNPNEAINFEKNNITYHPRNSFKTWRETVKYTSLPWEKDRLVVAESFRNFLIEYTLKKVYSLM